MISIDWHAFSVQGKKHRQNDDSYLHHDFGLNEELFLVADGVTWSAYPKIASMKAVLRTRDYFLGSEDEPSKRLANAFDMTHSELEREGRGGFATTLDAVLFMKDRMHYAHVGDGEIYAVEEGGIIRKLTNDNEFFLGVPPLDLECVETGAVDLQNIRYVLMFTDGVTRCVTDEDIQDMLRDSPSANEVCLMLERDVQNPTQRAAERYMKEREGKVRAVASLQEAHERLSRCDDATGYVIKLR